VKIDSRARFYFDSILPPCFDGGRIILDLPAICFQSLGRKTIGGFHAPKIQIQWV
jgi:hypothetical protein